MYAPRVRPSLTLIILALTLTAVPLASQALAATQGRVLFEGTFDPADMTWQGDDVAGRHPALPDTRDLAQPGQPRLPVRELLLLVPLDQQVDEVWIEPLATHTQALQTPVALAGPHFTDAGEAIATATMTAVDGRFPATWGESGGTHFWRGYQLLAVNVYPMRQADTPQGTVLEFLDAYAVRARTSPRTGEADVAQRRRFVPEESQANADVLRRLVANPADLTGYRRPEGQVVAADKEGFLPTAAPSLLGSGVSYLIVTNEEMAPAFQELADLRTAQGLPAVVVTREFIAANYRNGADIQETIRMFVRDAYELWGIDYLLLGGDTDVLPPRYVDNSYYPTGSSTLIPVDLYFACLDGNWNANGNALYAEPASGLDLADQADLANEIFVGRATVSSPQDVAVFVDKVIAYESAPATAKWTNRALFAAEVLFPDDWPLDPTISLDGAQFADQQINELIVPCTDMEYLRMYQTNTLFPWDMPLTRAALIDSLDAGHYGIVNQIGHGYYFNMSVADANFMNSDADALVNGSHLFMIYALNCASAAFDYSCLMERFVQNPSGGSVCSLGSARAAFPYNSNNYQQEFFDLLYCQGKFRVGEVMALSRLPFIGSTANNYVDRWTFENYTLLGDPALPIWTASPKTLTVGNPASLTLGQQNVAVTVSSGGSPVAGALVCLAQSGADYAFATTNALGQATLPFLTGRPGSATLKVSGRNLVLTTKSIPVVAATPYLTLSAMAVADDGSGGTAGNGNLVCEAGETVALTATLQETGGGALSGLSGTLTALDAGATVLSGAVTFPNVAALGFTTANAPFLVHLDQAVADGTLLQFSLSVTNGVATAQSLYETTVAAPVVEPFALQWQDATFGDGDGVIDGGEKLVVTLELKNYGFGTADGITGTLRSDDLNVVRYDSVATWSALAPMQSAAGSPSFTLSLTNGAVDSRSRILLQDDYGRTYVHEFSLQRPDVPGAISTSTSGGADVIALSWAPAAAADLYGYNVYRSVSASGPFVKVNQDVIVDTSYFRDEGLDLLTEYYYQIAAVDSSRVTSAMSAVIMQSTAPAQREGFPVEFEVETSGHAAVGDVDGDGDLEIVLASDEVYVWHHDGQELFDGDGDSQSLGPITGVTSLFEPAGVVLAELDGQPGQEMIVSERLDAIAIHIYRKDGTELPGWPRPIPNLTGTDWNWATPAVGDIDGDGSPEIVVNTLNGRTWAWHVDGTEVRDGDANPATNGVFYFRTGADYEWSMSAPALYDLDGDGAKDIIFGTRNDATGLKRLMALRYDGTDVPGFPKTVNGAVGASPAVADLNNDGMVEIIFFTNWRYLYAIQANGTNYPGFPFYYNLTTDLTWVTSPGVGDLDGDGQLEIVFAVNVSGLDSRLIAVDTDVAGGHSGVFMSGWPVTLPGSSEGSPVIGDIDGDGSPDIVHGIGGGDLNAPDRMYAFHADGTGVAGFPIALGGPAAPSAVITDLDGDWDVDIVFGGRDRVLSVWDMPFAFDPMDLYWPTFHGNMARNGVYVSRDLVDVPGGDVPAAAFTVRPPFPNPFNPSTSVRLYVPDSSPLEVCVFDLKGRLVQTLHSGRIAAGWHTLVWDGRDVHGRNQASGVYFLKAWTTQGEAVHKMTLVK